MGAAMASNEIVHDIYIDRAPTFFADAHEVDGERFHRISARVAKTGIVNRNRRLLRKGILEGETKRIAVSDWAHASAKGVGKPVGIADIREKGDFIVADTYYPVNDERAVLSYQYVKTFKDVIGYSLSYRPLRFDYRDDGGRYMHIERASIGELTPDLAFNSASEQTGVVKVDIAKSEGTSALVEIGALSDEDLIDELQRRGRNIGDLTPYLELAKSVFRGL